MTPTPVVCFLVAYFNARVRTGLCPPLADEGEIALIPKPGPPSRDDSNKRSLSLLNEVAAKFPNGILANRIVAVLHANPGLVDPMQRAYQHDGNHKQCLQTFLNTCEDFLERGDSSGLFDLAAESADEVKAFASAQGFSVKAGCECIGMPPLFVSYVENIHKHAIRRVRTAFGLTEPFVCGTGVHEGCPIAALLYIINRGPLLRALRNNPLAARFPERYARPLGYMLAGGASIHGVAYGDDTTPIDSCWPGLVTQAAFLVDWSAAHFCRIHPVKSLGLIASGLGVSSIGGPRFLPSLDPALVHDPANGLPAARVLIRQEPVAWAQVRPISTYGPDKSPRQLGLVFGLGLDPAPAAQLLAGRVYAAARRVEEDCLLPMHTDYFCCEYLVPRLENALAMFGLLFDHKHFARWRTTMRRAVLRSSFGCHVSSICNAALYFFAGIPDFADLAGAVAAIELTTSLRGPGESASTTWDRIHSACRLGQLSLMRVDVGGVALNVVRAASNAPLNRAARAIRYLLSRGITLSWRVMPDGTPVRGVCRWPNAESRLCDPRSLPLTCLGVPVRFVSSLADIAPVGPVGSRSVPCGETIAIFTDGSFDPSTSRCGSGVVMCKLDDLVPGFVPDASNTVRFSLPAPAAGRNWAGELTAAVAAYASLPLDVSTVLFADAKSIFPVLGAPVMPFGRLLRTGNHALAVTGRQFLGLRSLWGASSADEWVPAHTGGADPRSVMNSAADLQADLGACVGPSLPFLVNEEDAILWSFRDDAFHSDRAFCESFYHVAGNVTAVLRGKVRERAMSEWCRKSSQGRVASASPESLLHLIRLVKREADPVLHFFLLLFSTGQSPTADRVCVDRQCTRAALKCWLCAGLQSAIHVFRCPFSRAAMRVRDDGVRRALARLVALAEPYADRSPRWALLSGAPDWLDFFTVYKRDPPSVAAGDGFVERLARFCPLAGVLGVLPPGFCAFIFPDPALLGIEAPGIRASRKLAVRLIDELQMTMLRGAWDVFQHYQRGVVFPLRLSPFQLLAGPQVTGLLRDRRDAAHGYAAPAAPGRVQARAVRCRKGRAAVIVDGSVDRAMVARSIRFSEPPPAALRVSLPGPRGIAGRRPRRVVPRVRPRVPPQPLWLRVRRCVLDAVALRRLDVWRGRANPSRRSGRGS